MFIASLFTIAKMWKQPERPSVDEWIKKKKCSICTQWNVIQFSLWMNLEDIMLNEKSQSQDKYTYVRYLK